MDIGNSKNYLGVYWLGNWNTIYLHNKKHFLLDESIRKRFDLIQRYKQDYFCRYVLSEYSASLVTESSPLEVFTLLRDKFELAPSTTRHLLLTAAVKFRIRYPQDAELKARPHQCFLFQN